jgi:hypothetical protein
MNHDRTRQLQLGHAPQGLAQDFFFDFQLMFVAGVLVVAASAPGEILASRLDPLGRGFDELIGSAPREPRLLFGQRRLDNFAS